MAELMTRKEYNKSSVLAIVKEAEGLVDFYKDSKESAATWELISMIEELAKELEKAYDS